MQLEQALIQNEKDTKWQIRRMAFYNKESVLPEQVLVDEFSLPVDNTVYSKQILEKPLDLSRPIDQYSPEELYVIGKKLKVGDLKTFMMQAWDKMADLMSEKDYKEVISWNITSDVQTNVFDYVMRSCNKCKHNRQQYKLVHERRGHMGPDRQ